MRYYASICEGGGGGAHIGVGLLHARGAHPSWKKLDDRSRWLITSEEHTIPGVTCQALYSPLFMYNFHHFLNLSTFSFMYLTEITLHLNLFMGF